MTDLRPWSEGRLCPFDTDGDGDCYMCSRPEMSRAHELTAKGVLQRMSVEMAEAICDYAERGDDAKLSAVFLALKEIP